MKEECLICKAPLVYLQQDERMECAICHKRTMALSFENEQRMKVVKVIEILARI